jgi:hypothetical protein
LKFNLESQQIEQLAKQLRSNQLLHNILTATEQEIVEQWKVCDDFQERENLHAEQAGLRRFREKLEAAIRPALSPVA